MSSVAHMYKKGAFALMAIGVLLTFYGLSADVPDQVVSNAVPLGESGAYMLCRQEMVNRALDPDLAVIPGVRSISSDNAYHHFVWSRNSSQVGLPTLLGKVSAYNASCTVHIPSKTVTHLHIEGYSASKKWLDLLSF